MAQVALEVEAAKESFKDWCTRHGIHFKGRFAPMVVPWSVGEARDKGLLSKAEYNEGMVLYDAVVEAKRLAGENNDPEQEQEPEPEEEEPVETEEQDNIKAMLKGRAGALGQLLTEYMQQHPEGPDKNKPCWVISDRGGPPYSALRKGKKLPGYRKVVMQEFRWLKTLGQWKRTSTPEQYLTLNQALKAADWIGRLPNQGREKHVTTQDNFDRVRELRGDGKTPRQIERIMRSEGTKISEGSVRSLLGHA